MTVGDLLDQVVFDAGDAEGDYRQAARRWLNLARSHIYNEALWRSGLDPVATITTAAATTSGLYELSGYAFISGDWMFDQTTQVGIRHDSMLLASIADPAKTVFGPPALWADAGATAATGNRLIQFHPIPNDTRTIRFPAYRALTDFAAADEALTLDPFFGPIVQWQSVFASGMRYYHDQNNNEDPSAQAAQRTIFRREIRLMQARNRLTLTAGMSIWPTQPQGIPLGRLDPAQYDNSGRWL